MVRHARVVAVITLLGIGLLSVRCASDGSPPTGISAALTTQPSASGLLQCSKLPSTSVKQTIGSTGGAMRIGPQLLLVPSGALAQPVTISGKTPGVPGNAVHFKPVGLVFLRTASLALSYANCTTAGSSRPRPLA